jgi:hypothetical protein
MSNGDYHIQGKKATQTERIGLAATKPEPSGRFSTAPSPVIARQICSNDTASAATAASYRYQARVRELEQRFEIELQGVRDAYLQELAGLDLEGQ